MKEKDLITALIRYINFMAINHPQTITLTQKITQGMEGYKRVKEEILLQEDINPDKKPLTFGEYAKHILHNGSNDEKREIVKVFNKQLYIHNQNICSAPIS